MVNRSVLLAEHDQAHVALVREAVGRAGVPCTLDAVSSGAGVIDYLFARGRYAGRDGRLMPDLILLELEMPDLGGLQVLQILRRVRVDGRAQFPPVVVFTSSQAEDDLLEAYRLGAHSFVRKPAEPSRFVQTVSRMLQYWIGLNQARPSRGVEPPCFFSLRGRWDLPDSGRFSPTVDRR